MNIGILGTGKIAHTMAKTLSAMKKEDIFLTAVGSRTGEKSKEFADAFDIGKAYGSYEELMADPTLDLLYIAVPHSEHYRYTMEALAHGKNVLCEKALTTDASLARAMFAEAKKRHLLLAEAIWTRYMPSRKQIHDLIQSGIIGKPYYVSADLGYLIESVPRLTDPALAGGALLDVGVYPLNFAAMIFGDDYVSVKASCTYTKTGVDESDSYSLIYPGNRIAVLASSMAALTERKGIIAGDKGYLEVTNINNPEVMRVYDKDYHLIKEIEREPQISGYEYEVRECRKVIESHGCECPSMPAEESIRMMELFDAIRKQFNLVYPFEKR